MSQDDSTHADPQPQPLDAPPAARPQRPSEMRSAAPALCLFCANLLLGAVLLSGSLWPTLFALPQPAGVPSVLPTATATSAVGVQATDAPPSQATVLPAVQATAHATTQATVSVSATATTTSSAQQPTATPPTPVTASPTPTSTVSVEG